STSARCVIAHWERLNRAMTGSFQMRSELFPTLAVSAPLPLWGGVEEWRKTVPHGATLHPRPSPTRGEGEEAGQGSAALDRAPHDGADLFSGLQHLDAQSDDLVAVLEARGDERRNLVERGHHDRPPFQHAGVVDTINRWAGAAVEDRGERDLGDHGVR